MSEISDIGYGCIYENNGKEYIGLAMPVLTDDSPKDMINCRVFIY